MVLLTGSILTYLIVDYIVDARYARHIRNEIYAKYEESEFTFEDLVEGTWVDPRSDIDKLNIELTERNLNRKKPLIYGASVFFIGCLILLRKEKINRIVED